METEGKEVSRHIMRAELQLIRWESSGDLLHSCVDRLNTYGLDASRWLYDGEFYVT